MNATSLDVSIALIERQKPKRFFCYSSFKIVGVALSWLLTASLLTPAIAQEEKYETLLRQLSVETAARTASDSQSALAYFDIPAQVPAWLPNTLVELGSLRESQGVLFQAFSSGVTGQTPPALLPRLQDPANHLPMAFDHTVKWAYFANASYAGAFRYGASNGIVWYFVLNAGYLLAPRDPDRIRQLLNTAIRHLVRPWVDNESVVPGAKRIYQNQVYEALSAGKASPAGPQALPGEETARWRFVFNNPGSASAWQPRNRIAAGDFRLSHENLWRARSGGISGTQAPQRTSQQARTGIFKDGVIEWEWVASLSSSKGWRWYLYDTFEDMVGYRPPDSNDAYAGELLALAMRYVELSGDQAWLLASSGHYSPEGLPYSNLQVLKQVAQFNLLEQSRRYAMWEAASSVRYAELRQHQGQLYRAIQAGVSAGQFTAGTDYATVYLDGTVQWRYVGPAYEGLINTFQSNVTAANTSYDEAFLADACETWRGLDAFTRYLERTADAEAPRYRQTVDRLRAGISAMYRPEYRAWAWSQTSRIPQDWSSAWYPTGFANVQAQLYQVPVATDRANIQTLYADGWRVFERAIPFWWLRNFSDFPTLMPAYIALRDQGDVTKARQALKKSRRHYIDAAGLQPSGRFFIQEVAYALAIEKMLIDRGQWRPTDLGVFQPTPAPDASAEFYRR